MAPPTDPARAAGPAAAPAPATPADGDEARALVEAIAAGDRNAEARLVERFGRGLQILLARHTSGRPEAEDLFQDTFRVALEKLRQGELRDPSRLPGFLAGLARNLAIEHYRKGARRRTDADSEAVEAVATAAGGQLGELMTSEHAALVRRVIGELANERDRELLYRFYIAEEDKDEIAAAYDLSGLQFNRVLYRARQRYKELYEARLAALRQRGAAAVVLAAMILLLVPLKRGR